MFQTAKREDYAIEEGRDDPRDGAEAEEEDGGGKAGQRTGKSYFAKFLRIRRSSKSGNNHSLHVLLVLNV